ncbi:hypothetical protein D3C85_1483650 [compost metagenome]
MVGTSGRALDPLRLPTAKTLSTPFCTCGMMTGPDSTIIDTSPDISPVSAAAAPRYGTCMMFSPAWRLNLSMVRWLVSPVPPEP